jgi:hypothetical protein
MIETESPIKFPEEYEPFAEKMLVLRKDSIK